MNLLSPQVQRRRKDEVVYLPLQVLQGGSAEPPTKPKGRPRKLSNVGTTDGAGITVPHLDLEDDTDDLEESVDIDCDHNSDLEEEQGHHNMTAFGELSKNL